MSVIGDFHSHTMWGYSRAASSPSETDVEGMKSENVYVIMSVNDRLREVPEIVLIMVPRGRSGAFRLPVPSSEYGAVRKILEDKIRARVVNPEKAILGL